jgi:hypothetical protein
MTAIVTLIPAYKTDYLGDLFTGLISQKMKDFKVILSDDSPYGEVTEKIRSGVYGNLKELLNIVVVRGPCQGANKNIQYLINEWGEIAPFAHIHLDDDIIYPDFYRAHLQANSSGNFSASVSLRWVTNPDGIPDQEYSIPKLIETDNAHIIEINSNYLFNSTIPNCVNWVGEFTNILIQKKYARSYLDLQMSNISYYGLDDIGLILDISRKAPIAIIRDHLSAFRRNPQQSTAKPMSFGIKCGHLAWCALAISAWEEGRISDAVALQSLNIALNRTAHLYADDKHIAIFLELAKIKNIDLETFSNRFKSIWSQFLMGHPVSDLENQK